MTKKNVTPTENSNVSSTAPEIKPIFKKVKPAPKKTRKARKPKVTLVSYSMKMVIPTGNYANIQPEIIVKAGTVEEAHDFIAPHMNKLWKEYFMINERRPEPIKKDVAQSAPPQVSTTDPINTMPVNTPPVEQPPTSSVALLKATQAIQSCLSLEAFELIQNQVIVSVKLTDEDKKALTPLLDKKLKELHGN